MRPGHVIRWSAAVLGICFAAAWTLGCGDDDNGSADANGGDQAFETLEPGVLQIGMDIPFPPFHFGQPPDYEGFDVDLSNAIADTLDFELQIVRRPFETLIRDLSQNRYDLVLAATTVTPEREKVVDFSAPYFRADQSLVVAEGSDITDETQLADKTVGVQIGTSSADYVDANLDVGTVRTFDTVDDAFNAVNAEQVDAVVNDLPTSQDAVQKKPGLEIAKALETDEVYAVAFRKGTEDMQAAIERALSDVVEDGTYEELYKKWFKEAPPEEIVNGLIE